MFTTKLNKKGQPVVSGFVSTPESNDALYAHILRNREGTIAQLVTSRITNIHSKGRNVNTHIVY